MLQKCQKSVIIWGEFLGLVVFFAVFFRKFDKKSQNFTVLLFFRNHLKKIKTQKSGRLLPPVNFNSAKLAPPKFVPQKPSELPASPKYENSEAEKDHQNLENGENFEITTTPAPFLASINDTNIDQEMAQREIFMPDGIAPRNLNFIFHNKIPKAGSSTMKHIFDELAKKNHFAFNHVRIIHIHHEVGCSVNNYFCRKLLWKNYNIGQKSQF